MEGGNKTYAPSPLRRMKGFPSIRPSLATTYPTLWIDVTSNGDYLPDFGKAKTGIGSNRFSAGTRNMS